MSMSDARQFAELLARVERLEEERLVYALEATIERVDALEDRVYGKDVHSEVLGPTPNPEARDGQRTMLKERRAGIISEDNPLETLGVDYPKLEDKPKEAGEPDLPLDPGLKDRLAALQGGEAAPSKPAGGKR